MKKRKIVTSMIAIFLTLLLVLGINSYAATTQKFGLKEYRAPHADGTQYGYQNGANRKVWKIVKYANDGSTFDYNNSIYCLKAEQGFFSETGDFLKPVDYNLSYDFKDKQSMLKGTGLPVTEDVYNQVLWILDNSYIPTSATADMDKKALLDAAGIPEGSMLTDDDIDVVQQLAIWYYTNKEDIKYHEDQADGPLLSYLQISSKKGSVTSNYDAIEIDRQDDAKLLYQYLINTAEANKGTQITNKAPVTLNEKLKATIKEVGDNYILGPYKVDKNNDKPYTLAMTLKDDKNTDINYSFANADGTLLDSATTIKDLVDSEFYLSVPKTITTKQFKFNITGTYTDSNMTYWTNGSAIATTQPLVVIDKTPHDITGEKIVEFNQFDLSLRKFISKIGEKTVNRAPTVDTSKLNKFDNGTKITTAIYNHPKGAIAVKRNDIVTYTIRVYNEGDIDGFVNKVTDQLPPELEYLPEDSVNKTYGWVPSADGRTLTTDYLSKTKSENNLIKAFDGTTLAYKDLQVVCKVKQTAEVQKKLTNLAQISAHVDKDGNEITDRDSQVDNMQYPSDTALPEYKEDEIQTGKQYIPGQQDDDDFEKVKIAYFDLALRKFITGVDDKEVTDRIPNATMGEDGKIHYEHTKEPVEVENGNIVTYTLRIYNEGLISGYANKIIDDVPDGLEFLPDHETNKEYRWTISEDGKQIATDYLSKEQGDAKGIDNLIGAFDGTTLLYRDVKIAFKVTEPNTSDRILVNTAEIADDRDDNNDPIDDIDSIPDNNNEWNAEDDLDKEFVKVKYFDLALKKWVSKVFITENGTTEVRETGHTGDENPEPIVKVDLHRRKLSKVTVKFEFQIKVINEGEIAGYAKEVTDYIPEGLKFIAEDNKQWYVRDNDDRKVGTRALENTLLQPGESANVPILLTWINGEDNMGLKTNVAEISEDYNDSHTPDIDSTPDNKKEGEDDIDDAPVMLTIILGSEKVYYGIGAIVLVTIAGGVFLIKKYVL